LRHDNFGQQKGTAPNVSSSFIRWSTDVMAQLKQHGTQTGAWATEIIAVPLPV
jgi:hypothetical protein